MSHKKVLVKVNDAYQQNYQYQLTEKVGKNFHPDFLPQLKPEYTVPTRNDVFRGDVFASSL